MIMPSDFWVLFMLIWHSNAFLNDQTKANNDKKAVAAF